MTDLQTRVEAWLPQGTAPAQLVRVGAWTVVGLHVVLRAWMLLPSWFYSDDFIFLDDAHARALSADLLLTPHDSQLMPVGVALSWLVSHAGTFAWPAAATVMLALHLAAVLACWLMLRTCFGERWASVALLAAYAFLPMAPEAVMWWAAALNALPMQIAFFLLVTGVVRWFRDRTPSAAALSLGAIALAALSGPRGLVMLVPVALVAALFLVRGEEWRRPVTLVRRHLPLLAPLLVFAVAYLVLYRASTPSPVEASGDAPALAIARNLVLTSWLPALVGGPWRWDTVNPPLSIPDPPVVLHGVAVVVVAVAVVVAFRRNRSATSRALVVLVAQLLVTWVALVFGRGLQLGAAAGLTTRYLADTFVVTVLVAGLATLPLAGSSVSVRPPTVPPRLRRPLGGLGALVLVGALVSVVGYARPWHADYPARAFVQTAGTALGRDEVRLADVEVPDAVQARLSYPNNLPSRLLAPVGDALDATRHGTDLKVLDDGGTPRDAAVAADSTSTPGPVEGCGYRVTADTPVTIDLADADEMPYFWWSSIGYLSSGAGRVDVTADGRDLPAMDVARGLHTWFTDGEAQYRRLELTTTAPDLVVCVDVVRAGTLEAVAP